MSDIDTAIGRKIKEQRKRLNISQFELAEMINIHEKQIYRIESGKCSPSITNVLKIIKALNMDIRVLDYENTENFNPVKDEIYALLAKSNNEELVLVRNLILTIRESRCLTTKERKDIDKTTSENKKKIIN